VDVDAIVSVVALALVALIGANTWLILTVRDRIGNVDKRLDAVGQRIGKLADWLEGQSAPRKRGK
tara:strand:+ start:986 stop:1180 length:195 start_codon:yes stop_codon:yes gene_type:complete